MQRWRKTGNFREGYALRRLADIAEIQEDMLKAHSYLVDAFEVFVRHDCYRYRDEVRVHLDRLAKEMAAQCQAKSASLTKA